MDNLTPEKLLCAALTVGLKPKQVDALTARIDAFSEEHEGNNREYPGLNLEDITSVTLPQAAALVGTTAALSLPSVVHAYPPKNPLPEGVTQESFPGAKGRPENFVFKGPQEQMDLLCSPGEQTYAEPEHFFKYEESGYFIKSTDNGIVSISGPLDMLDLLCQDVRKFPRFTFGLGSWLGGEIDDMARGYELVLKAKTGENMDVKLKAGSAEYVMRQQLTEREIDGEMVPVGTLQSPNQCYVALGISLQEYLGFNFSGRPVQGTLDFDTHVEFVDIVSDLSAYDSKLPFSDDLELMPVLLLRPAVSVGTEDGIPLFKLQYALVAQYEHPVTTGNLPKGTNLATHQLAIGLQGGMETPIFGGMGTLGMGAMVGFTENPSLYQKINFYIELSP